MRRVSGWGATAARLLLEEHGVDAMREFDPDDIAHLLGFEVRLGPIEACRAYVAGTRRGGVIRVREGLTRAEHRFAVAHEIGHVMRARALRRDTAVRCTDESFLDWYKTSSDEAEANRFAAEFLMPTEVMERECDAVPSLDVVRAIADRYETSLTSAAIRFIDNTPERCAVVMSVAGRIKWSARTHDFGYWIRPGVAVDGWTLAYDFFKRGDGSKDQEPVRASAWLEDDAGELHPEAEVIEQCAYSRRYGSVLSLLWIPSDADF